MAHPYISTYICAINIVLTGTCGSSDIPLITIFSVAVITLVFAVYFVFLLPDSGLKHFQHHFFELILFGGSWGLEIAKISCAGILLSDKTAM